VKEKNTSNLLDRVGIGLRRMSGPDDIFRLDALDMRVLVLDDAVVADLDGAIAAHGDDRVGLDPFGDGCARQRPDQHAARRHAVDAAEPRLARQRGGLTVPLRKDFRGRLQDVSRQTHQARDVVADPVTGDIAAAMGGGDEDEALDR
jgi:hypothetical protein